MMKHSNNLEYNYLRYILMQQVYKELYETRNFKNGFKWGVWAGLIHGRLVGFLRGREPWNLRNKIADSTFTKPKNKY